MRSPIRWVGGKSRIANEIIQVIPEHVCYVEVFGGAAWVLFRKKPSDVEVLNDIDGELINFFRVVQRDPQGLIAQLEWALVSREEFERLWNLKPEELDEETRAYRFYYLLMSSWGGELRKARFQTSISDRGGGNRLIGALRSAEKRLKDAHRRLQRVIIEHLDWRDCLDKYDDPRTFFYLDPPYPQNNCNYVYNMRSFEEHQALFNRLRETKAKWLLSTYDKPELQALFDGYFVRPISFASGMNGYKNREILVANYDLEEIASQRA